MSKIEWEFSILQDGLEVAGGSAPTLQDAMREASHYGMVYAQDGPVRIVVKGRNVRGKAQGGEG